MFDYSKFELLNKQTRDLIIQESFDEKISGVTQPHSISSLINAGRDIGIASRMTSKPMNWKTVALLNGQLMFTGNQRQFSGKDIADIFVESALKGVTYYPMAGDWRNMGVEILVLFVKSGPKYQPYARFAVKSIQHKSSMSITEMSTLIDPTPLAYATFKSVLQIELIKENTLPAQYIGVRSGQNIYDVAFRGSSPNILTV